MLLTHVTIHARQFNRTQRTVWYEIYLLEPPKVLKPMDTDIGTVAPSSVGGVDGELLCSVFNFYTMRRGWECGSDRCLPTKVLSSSRGTRTHTKSSVNGWR